MVDQHAWNMLIYEVWTSLNIDLYDSMGIFFHILNFVQNCS